MSKKKKIFLASATLATALSIGVTAFAYSNSAGLYLANSVNSDLTVTIAGLTDSDSFTSGSKVVKTAPRNNDVTIQFSQVKKSGNDIVLKQNEGYLFNFSEIRSITSLAINGNGVFTLEWGWMIDNEINYINIVPNFTVSGSRVFTLDETPNYFKLSSARLASADSTISSVVATMDPNCVESDPVTVSLKSSDPVFGGDTYDNDSASNSFWTSYTSNPTGVYTLVGTRVGNEGLFFHPNNNSSIESTFMVDSSSSVLYVNHRTFSGTFRYRYRVNGDIILPQFFEGDSSKVSFVNNNEEVQFADRDGWTTMALNLQDFVGHKATVKIEITSGGDSAIGGVYFPFSTATSGFIGDTYDNDTGAHNAWLQFINNRTAHYSLWDGANANDHIANEGLKLHQNYDGYVQSKVVVSSSKTTWKVNIRSFSDRNSQFKFEVNDTRVTPVLARQGDSQNRGYVDSNNLYHAYDGWSELTYDLSSFVGQTITVKIQITDNGDAMIGGFYFA